MTASSLRVQPWQRSFLLNAAGMVVPIAVSMAALPVLLQSVGSARFGTFSLVLAVLAYLSVFDLGLGAAITYRVAAVLRDGRATDVPALVRTGVAAAASAGIATAGFSFLAGDAVAAFMLDKQPDLVREAASCLKVLALAVPAIFVYAVTSGLLSAHGEFGKLNLTRVPAGVLTAIMPAVAAVYWNDLVVAAWMLLLVRYAAALAQLLQCMRMEPSLWRSGGPWCSRAALRALLAFGGWLAVSNVVGPFMVYMDRFYLARTSSAVDVGYYVAAYELASKILLLPALVLPVFFPLLVRGIRSLDLRDNEMPVQLSAGMLLFTAFPAGVAAAFAPELFRFWMRDLVPDVTVITFQVLAAAAITNCVAQVFFTRVQALGRTDVIAAVHMAELVAYGVALWWLTTRFGVLGAAIAWAARVSVDTVIFCGLASANLPTAVGRRLWRLCGATLATSAVVAWSSQGTEPGIRCLAFVVPVVLTIVWWRDVKGLFQARVGHAANLSPV
jgi:O-antigen/teichoic acid export membrane protein